MDDELLDLFGAVRTPFMRGCRDLSCLTSCALPLPGANAVPDCPLPRLHAASALDVDRAGQSAGGAHDKRARDARAHHASGPSARLARAEPQRDTRREASVQAAASPSCTGRRGDAARREPERTGSFARCSVEDAREACRQRRPVGHSRLLSHDSNRFAAATGSRRADGPGRIYEVVAWLIGDEPDPDNVQHDGPRAPHVQGERVSWGFRSQH